MGPGDDGVQIEFTQSHLDSILPNRMRTPALVNPGPKYLLRSHDEGDGGGVGIGDNGAEVGAQLATVQTFPIPHSPDPRSTLTYPLFPQLAPQEFFTFH
jgi:hypothetical protein